MIGGSIHSRMLAVATVPVALVVASIVLVFWFGRAGDLADAHVQRGKLLARQVALASELGVFSGDVASLQNIANAVRRESDVVSVSIFDKEGSLLAKASVNTVEGGSRADVFREPVVASQLVLDDLYAAPSTEVKRPSQPLGQVELEVSRDSLSALESTTLKIALLVGALGILTGALLASYLGRGVVGPVTRVSRMVERIGHGDFTQGEPISIRDPLFSLQSALNQMSQRLAGGREELEQRVSQVTQELRVKKEEAELATRAKSRFLAAASHDLRQPTHALGLFVTRLGQLRMDDEARHVVNNLETSVSALQDLLDGLLDLSRLETGSVQAAVQALSIDQVLRDAQDLLEPIAMSRGLTLRVRFNGLWGRSDQVLLQRMVLNLGQNALRYTQEGSVLIACRLCEGGRGVRIEVWDSGIGIAPEHHEEIFKEFYQVGNLARDRRQGLGLGLSIVKRSAELLGHKIELKSMPGRGARFSITLPRAEQPDAVPSVVPLVASELDMAGMHILVVEDDPMAMHAVVSLLLSWGCDVSTAANAEEACRLVMEGAHPDVVLSDYRLEGEINGLETIQLLRARSGLPLAACLMSGDTDAALMQSVRRHGLTLLHKPVRPAKLRSLLRSLKA